MGHFEPKKVILTYQNFHIMPDFIKNDQQRFECFFDNLTPMLLIVPKQSWCHFEALKYIFHFGYKHFLSSNQLTLNKKNRAFTNLWLALYFQLSKSLPEDKATDETKSN